MQVSKTAKVFNIADEFLVHVFKAHLIASICTELKLERKNSPIQHDVTLQWLEYTAESLLPNTLMPATSKDHIYHLHRAFLHMGFLYMDLRNAIQYEDGPHIIRHWKWWLPRFVGTGCKNYASESVYLLANLAANFPKHIAYIAMHNRAVNMEGKPGRGKPIDQLIEHYNL